jgi:hypothetical protein
MLYDDRDGIYGISYDNQAIYRLTDIFNFKTVDLQHVNGLILARLLL